MPHFATLFDRLRADWHGHWLAFLLGALFPLSLAPFHAWPVALLALALFVPLLGQLSPRQAALRFWLFGTGLWASGASWLYVSIHDYGNTSAPLAAVMVLFVAVVMALFFAAQGWLYRRFELDRVAWLAFPALWVLFEWLRSWLFTGFPWLYAGYAFLDTPLAGLAPVGGVFSVSFLAVFTASVLGLALHGDAYRGRLIILAVAFWLDSWGLTQIRWTEPEGTPLKVAIVQPAIPQDAKWQLEWRDRTTARLARLSAKEWGKQDLILWPEAAVPMFLQEEAAVKFLLPLDERGAETHTALVTGIPYAIPRGEQEPIFHNSIIALGNGEGVYHKQRLVPFGEYVPFAELLRGLLPFFNLPMSSFTEGSPWQTPLRVGSVTLGPSICYEIAYPGLVRSQAAHSDVLVTISNDAWFGSSHGPHQHFQMVRMRALETGRAILRGTNNGISAVIGPRGEVQAQAPQFVQTVMHTTVQATRGLTPYVRFGEAPILALALMLLLTSAWVARQQRQRQRETMAVAVAE